MIAGEQDLAPPGRPATGEGIAPAPAAEVLGVYVYGIVAAEAGLALDVAGVGEPPGHVSVVRHGPAAAVVSDLASARPLGTRHDLRAHERVVQALHDATTVLPMRFGTAVDGVGTLLDLLGGPQGQRWADRLSSLAGYDQWTVLGRYDEAATIGSVLAEVPEARKLQAGLLGAPEGAGYHERIRLGEIISRAWAQRRAADVASLVGAVGALCAAHSVAEGPENEHRIRAAFLVARAHRAAFEEAIDAAGRQWHPRVQLRLLGPHAPFDFVGAA